MHYFPCKLQNFNAKLTDFGLATNGPIDGKTHVTTRVLGTEGYAAPEYMGTGIFQLITSVDNNIWRS